VLNDSPDEQCYVRSNYAVLHVFTGRTQSYKHNIHMYSYIIYILSEGNYIIIFSEGNYIIILLVSNYNIILSEGN